MAVTAGAALLLAACGNAEGEIAATGDTPDEVSSTGDPSGDEPSDPTGDVASDPIGYSADRPLQVIVRPDPDGLLPPDVGVGCPSGPTFPASALDETRPLAGSGLDEVEREVQGFLDNAEGQSWPQDGWLILYESENEVLVVNGGGESTPEGGLSFMTVERVGGEWRWAGSSSGVSCPLTTSLPPGLNTVEWRLDPSAPKLGPDTKELRILAMERECVSGREMGDRLLDPEVVYTDDAVLLAFAAVPAPGADQNCQGNPEQAVAIELTEPLGGREVLNGMTVAGDLLEYLEQG